MSQWPQSMDARHRDSVLATLKASTAFLARAALRREKHKRCHYELRVTTTGTGEAMTSFLRQEAFDLLLLDLRLPDEDGLLLARELRQRSNMPIIILTERLDEADRVMSLELGADDYLTKPFSPRELLARIRALLRRSRMHTTLADGVSQVRTYRFAEWELNVPLRKLISPSGKTVPVSIGEFNRLVVFLSSPRQTLARSHLLDHSHVHNAEYLIGQSMCRFAGFGKNSRVILATRG